MGNLHVTERRVTSDSHTTLFLPPHHTPTPPLSYPTLQSFPSHPLHHLPHIPPHHTTPATTKPNGERGGSVIECRTPEREVGGSKPTAAVLCPWARHFTPRKYWLITQEAVAPSRHDWKIVDWDVKPQHKQTNHQAHLTPRHNPHVHHPTNPHKQPHPFSPTHAQSHLNLEELQFRTQLLFHPKIGHSPYFAKIAHFIF